MAKVNDGRIFLVEMEKMPENMPEKTDKGKRSKRVKFDKDEEGLKRVKDSRRQHDDYGLVSKSLQSKSLQSKSLQS